MKFGIASLLVYAVISCGAMLSEQYNAYTRFTRHSGDPISEYEKRFTRLRQVLPRNGAVGFLSDDPAPFLKGDYVRDGTLYLTQYALSPVVVYDTAQVPLVVGNFHSSSAPSPELWKNLRLRPIANYGNGVVLFKREEME
jgi:hypothetical protein